MTNLPINQSVRYIPKHQWWCGCYPNIKFKDEHEFAKHMKSAHNWGKKQLDLVTERRESN